MYWREHFKTPQALIATARRFRAGMPITRAQHVAIQHGLGELTETPELGSLKSFFKKAVKVANKLDPLYSVRKKIDPVTKAVNKAVGIAPNAAVSSAPKTPPSQELVVPLTPTVPMDTSPVSLPFNMQPGQSGGGGGFSPAQASADPAAATADSGPNWWLIGGATAAGLAILYLLMKKRR